MSTKRTLSNVRREQAPVERAAYTVDEFAEAHSISRGMLYKLWLAGTGPRFIQVGSKRLIPVEAAAEWRNRGAV